MRGGFVIAMKIKKYQGRIMVLGAVLVMGLALTLPSAAAVQAVADTTNEVTNTTTTTSNDSSPSATSTTSTTPTAQQKQQLEDRIKSRISSLKITISNAQKARITERCTAAQNKLDALKKKLDNVHSNRTQVYGGVSTRLTALSEKLKAQGVDTTTLDTDIKALNTKTETLKTDLAAYKQAVEDAIAVDCKSDPTAFQASLEAARKQLDVVRTDAQAISDYVKNTIKPLLETLRQQLEAKETTAEGSN